MQGNHLTYRRDIDGLRALAVLAVVIFHFNNGWLPGGFVGVDIFFVISGYLITGIIYRQGSDFSFGSFYGNRVRRILPAATFVTVVTLLAGSFLLLPADVSALSSSSIWAALTAANVYFWLYLDTGYFAASSDTVPLLHMWSLGVEEQFYMLWPALMVIALKIGGKRMLAATGVALAIASFAVSEYYLTRDPSFAYYMLPSRAGELLVGALLFLLLDSRRIPAAGANLAGAIGFFTVAYSLFFLSEKGGFPGVIAIIPSVGAAMLILSGTNQANLISKAFSTQAARYIGLRSFSLYLWHWPVLAFYRYAYGEPNLIGGLMCLLVMCLLTEISYTFIETPFRSRSPRWLLTKAAPTFATSAAVLVVGYVLVKNYGYWPTEAGAAYKEELQQHDNKTKAAFKFSFNCQMSIYDQAKWNQDQCINGDKSAPVDTLLWGDSNAAHYVGYLKVIAEARNFAFRNISHSACPPVRNVVGLTAKDKTKSCEEFNNKAFSESKKYKTVIIGAAWEGISKRSGKEIFAETISELAANGNKVIIALNVPSFWGFDRMCAAKSIRIPGMSCSEKATIPDKGESQVNLFLKGIADRYPNVSTLDIRHHICLSGICSAYHNGTPLYYDHGHLSMSGSELIGRLELSSDTIPQSIASLSFNLKTQ